MNVPKLDALGVGVYVGKDIQANDYTSLTKWTRYRGSPVKSRKKANASRVIFITVQQSYHSVRKHIRLPGYSYSYSQEQEKWSTTTHIRPFKITSVPTT